MNKNKLKTYAPQAREEFIKIVTERAALYGITAKKIEPCQIKGDYAFISGKPFSKSIEKSRDDLIKSIESKGFTQVMEEVAYTWFNRFAAIRFMELNGYLSHGYRVLSHPQGQSEPEILEKAQYLERLDGLEKEEIIALKTAGNKDAELYRKLIIAQCNELHSAMPFLFERVDDPTELLLPDNLLNTDSVIRQMVDTIPEEDWKEVEIIGWLYQFYISEKKASLMKVKKAYKTEDIPAVTQLFTPNWIVKYLVQNSLGAKWLGTYPTSDVKKKMEYYIEPAEQTDEVRQQLKEITPDSLNPEELTVMDPACGSGHILVEAYDLLKEIYLERGFRPKDVPALILAKNLYGLEIDDRAAQLAGFALMMKARQDDREIFKKGIKPNIVCIQGTDGKIVDSGQWAVDSGDKSDISFLSKLIAMLIEIFKDAKAFGSLIRVSEDLQKKLPEIRNQLESKKKDLDRHELWSRTEHFDILLALVKQAEILSKRYDCVIANPPYMGGKGMNGTLKEFAKTQYPATKSDLFAMFIERGFEMAKDGLGYNAMVTMQSWMFLSSYEKMRQTLLNTATIRNMVHMTNGVMGIAFGTCATVWCGLKMDAYKGSFSYIENTDLNDSNVPRTFPVKNDRLKDASSTDFKMIPGSPIAYWVKGLDLFREGKIGDKFISGGRNKTHDDTKYLRLFWEISSLSDYWKPYANGGEFRKYFGNIIHVVNWTEGARKEYESHGGLCNSKFWWKEGVTWSLITSAISSFRIKLTSCQYSSGSPTIFNKDYSCDKKTLAFLNSKIAHYYLKALNPTLNTTVNDIFALPNIYEKLDSSIDMRVEKCISIAELDWNSRETSLNFEKLPILHDRNSDNLQKAYQKYKSFSIQIFDSMKSLEEENNRIFIDAYGLQDELTPEVSWEEITLTCNPYYRYGKKVGSGQGLVDSSDTSKLNTNHWPLTTTFYSLNNELEARFKTDTMKELISYAIGCMMGRYSLDAPGLILASTGEGLEDYFRKVGSDQWLVASKKEKTNVSKELQGPDSLAEGDGIDSDGISSNKEISQGGALRVDQSDSQSSGIDSIQYSRGASKTIDSGVQKLSINSARVSGRSGNTAIDCQSSDIYNSGRTNPNTRNTSGSQQNDSLPNEKTNHCPLDTNHCPLDTGHFSFLPDEDGIIPITEREWFDDDAACRFFRFIETVWGRGTKSCALLEDNLDFIADAIGRKSGESSRETIRRYFSNEFFRDHMQTYKNRPIYWLFSSGKEKAFQALVYLHRYNEGTLSRMRTEYVLPLQTKISRQIEHLEKDKDAAQSGSAANKIQKEILGLRKQAEELGKFDELLRHYADKRIRLDLDDGVKVNYGKFGELLSDVKKIAGTKEEEDESAD